MSEMQWTVRSRVRRYRVKAPRVTRLAAAIGRLAEVTRAEVGIEFCGRDRIRTLNRVYRRKDRATDVLSFSILHPRETHGHRTAVGDVVVCLDLAERQARALGHSLDREVAFLLTHGVLHLLGYDHVRARDHEVMFARQDWILARLKDAEWRGTVVR